MLKEFFFCSIFLLLVGCGYSDDKSYSPPPSTAPSDPGKPLNGQALFAAKCASCHGGATPNIAGEDEADIKRALATVGAMKRVVVSDPEIKAIAEFLEAPIRDTLPAEPVDTLADGEELYFERCASCHGSSPDVAGASQSQIISALRNVRAMKNVRLDSTQAQRVSDFLNQTGGGAGGGGGSGGGEDDDDDDEGGDEGDDD